MNHPSQRRRKTGQIAVICTYISEYIFPSILRGIEQVTKENDYQLLMNSTNNSIASERAILSKLRDNPPDGIIVEGTKTALPNPNREFYHSLAENGVPIVFINSYYPDIVGENVIHIVADDYSGGFTATQTLIREGHRNICGIFKSDDTQGTNRYSGYMDAIVRMGASVRDNNVIWFSTETKELLLRSIGDFLMGIDRSCTAVVCYNDQIAATVLRFFETNGDYAVRAVASFDRALPIDSNILSFVSLSAPKGKDGPCRRREALPHDRRMPGRIPHARLGIRRKRNGFAAAKPFPFLMLFVYPSSRTRVTPGMARISCAAVSSRRSVVSKIV